MELVYYRNLNPNSFYSDVDFNLSSGYNVKANLNYIENVMSDPYSHVEVAFEIEKLDGGNVFVNDDVITDVTVVVGENGVGKSTLLNDILYLGSQPNLTHSWQILLSHKFLLIGEKVNISIEEIQKLRALFPELIFINSNTNFYPDNLHYFVELEKNQSLYQFLSGKKHVLFNYSNSIEPNKISNYSGKVFSTSEQMEEGISVVDISTSNYLVQSNKWGLDSILKETIFENNLLSLDTYQVTQFLELYFKFPWFKSLFPESILNKIEVRFHSGVLPELFNRFIQENNLFLNFDTAFPNYYRILNFFKADYVTHVYRELLLTSILKLVDFYADPAVGINTAIKQILDDFEHAVNGLFLADKDTYDVGDIIALIEKYRSNSRELNKIDFESIWVAFKQLMEFSLKNNAFSSQFVSVGLDEFSGIRLKLEEMAPDLHQFLEHYAALTSLERFKLPFLKFSITNLSAGERNFVFFITRLIHNISILGGVGESPNNFTIMLDEPGNDYHPEWQRGFFNNLRNALINYSTVQRKIKVHFIITTHSPFVLSDFANENIIKLEKVKMEGEGYKTIESRGFNSNTFGANVYDLLSDSFFLKNGFIGEFAKGKIDMVFNDLKNKIEDKNYEMEISQSEIKYLVRIVGEPLLQRQLSILYDKAFKDENLEIELIDRQIEILTELRKRKSV